MTEAGGEAQSRRAFGALVDALRDGELPSSSFHSMQQLVSVLGFPISSIREAVKRAEAQGLVEILPKRGIQVMSADLASTRNCMDMRATLDKEGARRLLARDQGRDWFDLRAVHEALLSRARAGIGAAEAVDAIDVDLSLHDALAEELDNPLLRRCYEENRTRIAIIQNTRPFLADRVASAMEEHLAIISAIEAGDEPAAMQAIDLHFVQTLRWWGIHG
ncbi:GntR family transcriptional regulator [Mameliella alba]|uniref:Putative transcriptional regulator GntR family protein n=1 Tax=Mameliella alba TaxID=561184 RepID=A0A0B3S348_9RHOB|nr:GntR family transcriptional regulator [Mameliella alba]KHQ53368.1 putative transcriptional regulator GntR family protein [Mameliella alba]